MEHNFDAAAATWDDDPHRCKRAAAVAGAIISKIELNQSMQAIEVGCGTGLLGYLLLPYVGHLTFADNSRLMLDRVIEKTGDKKEYSIFLFTGQKPRYPLFE